ncbi:hypothetical protein [Paenibacillus larvae]|nr:hypothetical protein [Paenibacillus larvae]
MCHTDEFCFYCEYYLPLEEKVTKLQSELEDCFKRERHLINSLLKIREILAWGDAEFAADNAAHHIYKTLKELEVTKDKYEI